MTKIYQPQSSIVLHHSSCRVAPVLASAHPAAGSGYHQCMHTSYRLEMSNLSLHLNFSWNFPFNMLKTVACCQQLHNPTLVTSQVRVQELRQLSQHDQTNCPVLDSQEVHKSSWEGTARRCTGIRTKRHRSFKLSLQFKLATGKVVGVRRAVYPGGGPRNGHRHNSLAVQTSQSYGSQCVPLQQIGAAPRQHDDQRGHLVK